ENLDDNVLHHHYDVASNTDFNDDFLEIFGKDDDGNHRQHRNHRLLSTDNRHQNTDPNKNKSAPISVKNIDGQIINSEDRKQKLLINFRLKLNKYALCKNDSDSFVDPSESECFEKFELLRKMKSIENKQKFHQNVKKTSFFTVEKFIQEKFEENKQNFLRKWWKSICENNLSNVAEDSSTDDDEHQMSINNETENQEENHSVQQQRSSSTTSTTSIHHNDDDEQLHNMMIKPEHIWIGKQVEIGENDDESIEMEKVNYSIQDKVDDNSIQKNIAQLKNEEIHQEEVVTTKSKSEIDQKINLSIIKIEQSFDGNSEICCSFDKNDNDELNDNDNYSDHGDNDDDEKANIEDWEKIHSIKKHCQELMEKNNINEQCLNEIKNYLKKLKPNLIENSSELLFYLIIVLFNLDQNYKYCIELCRLKKMPLKFHRKLQQIWDLSWEQLELQRKNVQFLTCVQRFRLKQRNPYPSTITIGSRIKYGIPMKFKKILINYYDNVNKHPTTYDKEKLAEKTKLTVKQVSTFFKNRRNRIR
ncbi:hypothetical protein DERP_002676, partial [Dermatophagoides pteronyssinus]